MALRIKGYDEQRARRLSSILSEIELLGYDLPAVIDRWLTKDVGPEVLHRDIIAHLSRMMNHVMNLIEDLKFKDENG